MNEKIEVAESPRLFLTDYASYNNGTQFEFGHWVDLDDFADADEFMQYCTDHLAEADAKSPLPCGSEREEIMFTDYENFPRCLYSESCNPKDLEAIYEWVNMEGDHKRNLTFLLEDGQDMKYALSIIDHVNMHEDHGRQTIYELFSELYPEADKADDQCEYLSIDYDRFKRENFTEWSYEGTDYLVEDGWNN
jgi:hypothetical protein